MIMKMYGVWLVAAGIGVVDAVLLFVFELIGVNMTNWLWNDVLQTDKYRWLVLPTALVLGLVFTGVIKVFKAHRVISPESDLIEDMDNPPSTLPSIGVVLAIGAASLLAGASLGPEAPLMAGSAGIGAYAADRWKLSSTKRLLVLASVGALLISFVGSMILVLIPLLILFQAQKNKRPQLKPVAIILLAGLTSFVTIQAIDRLTGKHGGYGSVPALPDFVLRDFVVALILGFVTGFLAFCLNWLINKFWLLAKRLDCADIPAKDWLVGLVFSGVLGCLYLLGGRTIEFSGSVGSGLLASGAANYGVLALIGLIITKILVTAWSKGTGYRGGLVFPSVYVGLALGLLFGNIFVGLGGSGALIGSIAGILTAAIGSPIMSGVFLIALLPYKLWPVAFCAILGTMIFSRVVTKRSN